MTDDQQPFIVKATLSEEFSAAEAQILGRLVEGCQVMIDVGSFTGASAHTMLSHTDGWVLCVDHFTGIKTSGEHKSYTEMVPPWMMFSCLQVRLREFAGRFSVFVGTSHQAAIVCKPHFADFVFIDASHVYNQLAHDIDIWWPILKPGGVMAGHDFDKGIKDMSAEELRKQEYAETMQGGYHPGVVRAVREKFKTYHLAEDEASSIWWTVKEETGGDELPTTVDA